MGGERRRGARPRDSSRRAPPPTRHTRACAPPRRRRRYALFAYTMPSSVAAKVAATTTRPLTRHTARSWANPSIRLSWCLRIRVDLGVLSLYLRPQLKLFMRIPDMAKLNHYPSRLASRPESTSRIKTKMRIWRDNNTWGPRRPTKREGRKGRASPFLPHRDGWQNCWLQVQY